MNTSDLENTQAANPLPPHHAGAAAHASARRAGETADAAAGERASTLIEFPGANRNRPAWRKELSERVREIQQRRAREAALEADEATRPEGHAGRAAVASEDSAARAARAEERAKQLGLVPPPPETPELNPIVVAALKRIERARTPPQRGRSGRATHAATAAARVVEERYEPAAEAPPVEQAEPKTDTGRLPNLVALPPKQPAPEITTATTAATVAPVTQTDDEVTAVVTQQPANTSANASANTTAANAPAASAAHAPAVERVEPNVAEKVAATPRESVAPQSSTSADTATVAAASAETFDKPQPRRIKGVIDDHWLERHGVDPLPKVVTAQDLYDDRASVVRRCAAAMVDLLVVGFLSAPFAAVIELMVGNWGDLRVQASMGGVVLVMMFLYLTCSTALAGRTFGQRLFALHTVDANSALAPTTGQCVRRTIVYMLSLATFGLGLLYALFDAEGRTAHDLLSRTVIVKE